MANIRIANAGTIFFKRKSTTFLNRINKWQNWQTGSWSPPQGTRPAAREIKGKEIKIAREIIKNIFFTIISFDVIVDGLNEQNFSNELI